MIPNERKESKNPIRYCLSLGWARIDLRPTCMNLLNPTLGRDASYPCLISFWLKEGCTVVCVSRSLPIPYLIGGRDKSPPTNYKKEKQFTQCQFFVYMVLIKKIYAKMQKSSFNFHKFSFQSYKFGFFHFIPLIFIPSQLSHNFFYINFFS